MSKGFELSGIFKKPAHCSKDLGPIPLTFFNCSLSVKIPSASRRAIIFFAREELTPETYFNKETLAVFKFTPTLFTTEPTTASSSSLNFFWFKSCWYKPTPMDLGSIFTSSARGSCNLLPIEIAPLIVKSKSGNSSRATSPAE